MAKSAEEKAAEAAAKAAEDLGPGIEKGEATIANVQSVTHEVHNPEDETPMPNVLGTDTEDPPLHTARPDVPIAQVLASGAGEHTPPDPKEFDKDGRPRNISDGS
jgi:hypothetical protein